MAGARAAAGRVPGIDIPTELIEENHRRYSDRAFRVADLATADLPSADLVLGRDALVHFPLCVGLRGAVQYAPLWGGRLLTTSFVGRAINHAIALGEWRALILECAPSGFPAPARTLVERCSEGGDRYRGKALCLRRFADLPRD